MSHYSVPIVRDGESDDELVNGVDFDYAYYKDGVKVSEVKEEGLYKLVVTGKEQYSGTQEIIIEIYKKSIEHCTITWAGVMYNDKEKAELQYGENGNTNNWVPAISMKGAVAGTDYDYEYYKGGVPVSFNGELGTYTLKIRGKGNYKGELTLYISIGKYKLSKDGIELSKKTFAYDKKKHAPVVKIKAQTDAGFKLLKKGVDYSISGIKAQRKIGKYTIVIKGKGNYKGTVKLTWSITPRKASFVMSSKNNSVYVTPKSQNNITGYQIEYASSSAWNYGSTELTFLNKKSGAKLLPTNYVKNVKVYARVRAYKTVNGKKIYGARSTEKMIRVKGNVKLYYF